MRQFNRMSLSVTWFSLEHSADSVGASRYFMIRQEELARTANNFRVLYARRFVRRMENNRGGIACRFFKKQGIDYYLDSVGVASFCSFSSTPSVLGETETTSAIGMVLLFFLAVSSRRHFTK